MAKVALYMRVSTDEQALNGLSLEAQKEVLEKYAKDNNYEIIDSYTDAGISARKKIQHRKELIRLLDDVRKGRVDLILFTKLDRWFRNISDYYKVQEILDKYHVNWKTIFEEYDTSTANGRLHINIMLSIAQDEADRTSERIKAVFESKRSKGETSANKAPIGYKIENSKLLVDDDKKQIAIDIFSHYDINHSMRKCIRMVYNKYNIKIDENVIRKMLRNRTYIGEYRGIDNFCESIIPSSQFERINSYTNIRVFKNQLEEGRVYLFQSLITCKHCGRSLNANAAVRNQINGIKEYHYYRCRGYLIDKCDNNININEQKVERFLLDHIQDAAKINIKNRKKKNETTSENVDINKLKKRLEKLKDLYLDDIIDKSLYKNEFSEINSKIQAAEKIKNEKQESNLENILNVDIGKFYKSFSPEEKRIFWLNYISKITVDSNSNIIFFIK